MRLQWWSSSKAWAQMSQITDSTVSSTAVNGGRWRWELGGDGLLPSIQDLTIALLQTIWFKFILSKSAQNNSIFSRFRGITSSHYLEQHVLYLNLIWRLLPPEVKKGSTGRLGLYKIVTFTYCCCTANLQQCQCVMIEKNNLKISLFWLLSTNKMCWDERYISNTCEVQLQNNFMSSVGSSLT